jgi:hypothetical protein
VRSCKLETRKARTIKLPVQTLHRLAKLLPSLPNHITKSSYNSISFSLHYLFRSKGITRTPRTMPRIVSLNRILKYRPFFILGENLEILADLYLGSNCKTMYREEWDQESEDEHEQKKTVNSSPCLAFCGLEITGIMRIST